MQTIHVRPLPPSIAPGTAARDATGPTEGSQHWLLAILAMLARRRQRLQPRHYTS